MPLFESTAICVKFNNKEKLGQYAFVCSILLLYIFMTGYVYRKVWTWNRSLGLWFSIWVPDPSSDLGFRLFINHVSYPGLFALRKSEVWTWKSSSHYYLDGTLGSGKPLVFVGESELTREILYQFTYVEIISLPHNRWLFPDSWDLFHFLMVAKTLDSSLLLSAWGWNCLAVLSPQTTNWAFAQKKWTITLLRLYPPHRLETPPLLLWILVGTVLHPYMVRVRCGAFFGSGGCVGCYRIHSSSSSGSGEQW